MIKNLRPKLAEHGKIKIGRLGEERPTKDKQSTYRLPTKLDHFLITTTERDRSGNFTPDIPLMEKIAEIVGEPADHLTTIPVCLLFDDIDQNFYTTYNCYQGRTRICTGDGEKAVLLKTGEEISCPCPRLEQDYQGKTPCKPYGRLTMVLQSMNMVGGSWVYRTTGWNSVQDILGSLALIKKIAGRLAGIPLMLKLSPKTTQLPRGPVTVYTVTLVYAGSPMALVEEAKELLMIHHDENLTTDQTIKADEETEIQEEFFPPETETEKGKADADAATERVFSKKKEPEGTAEEKEPTAADLAKKAKQTEDAKKKRQAKAQAAAKKKKEDADEAAEAVVSKQGADEPLSGEPPIEESEVMDEPASDSEFGWV